jgi:L-seryl-tRNA(Ser) seleniumtransferase
MKKKNPLSVLPSVNDLLMGDACSSLLTAHQRPMVLQAIRDVLSDLREKILKGIPADVSEASIFESVRSCLNRLSSFSLVSVINATGIVLHTNLGRATLSEKAIRNVVEVSRGYSNLEYDIQEGRRGKRHVHTGRILKQLTGAEDAMIVNNNAAAVFLSLNTLAKGREVIVSRGELVEIGGSFRVPDVMSESGSLLREVGTTNKTHLYDYERAINENTGLILKVHQSNYKMIGFTEEVSIQELAALGKERNIPVMYDLGSGCLIDLKPYGIHSEPSVQEIMRTGVDLLTFSGDKLLGGPQGGLIVGRKNLVSRIMKNPIARAMRVDKMTIAAFEATLMEYIDTDRCIDNIPVLRMLFQTPETIRTRAGRIRSMLKRQSPAAEVRIIRDISKAGGGSLPDAEFETYAVSVAPDQISVNELEQRLRLGSPSVIARIKDDALIIDARTVQDMEIKDLVRLVIAALQ